MSIITVGFVFVIWSLAPLPPPAPASYTPAVAGPVALAASDGISERAADAAAMLSVINTERSAHGLVPLESDQRLCAIARSHAVDMAARSYFGHDTPEGASPFDRLDRAHYRYGFAGENLALDASVAEASSELWHSSEHRSNILQSHFVRVGIAAVRAADGEIFVEDFSD